MACSLQESSSDDESTAPKAKKSANAASDSSSNSDESEEDSEDDKADNDSEMESVDEPVKPSRMSMALKMMQAKQKKVVAEECEELEKVPQPEAPASKKQSMSDTAVWRSGVLGPTHSPKLDAALAQKAAELAFGSFSGSNLSASLAPQCSPCIGSRPPYAPAFEVAKFPAGYPPSNVGPTAGSGRDSGRGSSSSSGLQQVHRAASEGRFPKHVDFQNNPRKGVSRALENLEKHPDSLLARARAPQALPRFVAPPQGPSYAPPARDSWEYDRVDPRAVVNVVRLESQPYVRKGRTESQNNRQSRGKQGGLDGIYGPLVQMKEREREPRSRMMQKVRSLPALAPSHSPPPPSQFDAHPLFQALSGSSQRLIDIR